MSDNTLKIRMSDNTLKTNKSNNTFKEKISITTQKEWQRRVEYEESSWENGEKLY
jgi:hypothetical protein